MKIEYLCDHPGLIIKISQLWYENLGKIWVPNASVEAAKAKFLTHLNKDNLPLTLIALEGDQPIGMASLRISDGIRPELTPWLASLVVDKNHRGKGLGPALIKQIKLIAKDLGYEQIYLLTFDPTLPTWYQSLGWEMIGSDCLLDKPANVMRIDL